jgi:hypothetical protein
MAAVGLFLYTVFLSLALLGLVVAVAWVLARGARDTPVLAPNRRLIILGFGLMVVGPTLLWSMQRSVLPRAAAPVILDAPAVATGLALSWGSIGLFVVGFILTGAGLRPRANPGLGIRCALGVYVACGVVWLLVFVDDGMTLEKLLGVLSPIAWPFVLVQILIWPGHLAQRLGLFG